MNKEKRREQEKRGKVVKWEKRIKWLMIPLVASVFLAALATGIMRFQIGKGEEKNTVQKLEGPWVFTTDQGERGEISLPNVLSFQAGTGEIRLDIMLPEWTGEAYAVHFTSMEQSVQVLVEGESRYVYGADPNAEDFVYRSAHHINEVDLKQQDSGKRLTIIYRAPVLFSIELGLLREVHFGTKSDLMLYQFRKSIPYIAISFFSVLITMSALIMLTAHRGMAVRGNLWVVLLTGLTVVFFNSENTALWPVLHYQAALSTWTDWVFYYLDPLIQLTAWFSMYTAGWRFRRWRRWAPAGFGMVYTGAVIGSLLGYYNFNLTRPFFMVTGFSFTALLLWEDKKYRGGGERNPWAFPLQS